MDRTWEDWVSLNSQSRFEPRSVKSVKHHLELDDGSVVWNEKRLNKRALIKADSSDIPTTEDREGYYGANHYNYWASGARDLAQILDYFDKKGGVAFDTTLDFGCASGRLTRHLHHSGKARKVMGCDINRKHVDWASHYLPRDIITFQNTSVPHLPLSDASVDLITSFSVFTHIEAFEDTWFMELDRILRPEGIVWITIHGDRTWREVEEGWPLYEALKTHPDYAEHKDLDVPPFERTIYRWISDTSYSSNVFYTYEFVQKRFGQFYLYPFR